MLPLAGAFGPPAGARNARAGRLAGVVGAERPAVDRRTRGRHAAAVLRRQSSSNGSVGSSVYIASLCGLRLQFSRCAVAVGVLVAVACAADAGYVARVAVVAVELFALLLPSSCSSPSALSLPRANAAGAGADAMIARSPGAGGLCFCAPLFCLFDLTRPGMAAAASASACRCCLNGCVWRARLRVTVYGGSRTLLWKRTDMVHVCR